VFSENRKLDDAELDSGDDEGRTDRVRAPEAVEDVEQQTFAYMDADLARHPVPEPTDNELYLLKVPRFLSFEDKAFDHKTFQPPTTDHHSKVAASEHFSAYNTAMTTIRWRRSPSNNALLQSNARILRWSDGSLTLQLATKIPTPTAVRDEKNGKTSSKKESYTYLVAPYEEANVMRVTNKLTASLNVVPTSNTKDAALEKLQNDLAKVAAKGRDDADQAISFINVDEDPELRRQRGRDNCALAKSTKRARQSVQTAPWVAPAVAPQEVVSTSMDWKIAQLGRRTRRRVAYGVTGVMMRTTVAPGEIARMTTTRRTTSLPLVTRSQRLWTTTMTRMRALHRVPSEHGVVLLQTMTMMRLLSAGQSGDAWLTMMKMRSRPLLETRCL
jgi:hypothetical protein